MKYYITFNTVKEAEEIQVELFKLGYKWQYEGCNIRSDSDCSKQCITYHEDTKFIYYSRLPCLYTKSSLEKLTKPKEMIVTFQNFGSGHYYIHSNKGYLHADGVWRGNWENEEGALTGLYFSKAQAQKIREKYYPLTLADVKPGQKFKILTEHYKISGTPFKMMNSAHLDAYFKVPQAVFTDSLSDTILYHQEDLTLPVEIIH